MLSGVVAVLRCWWAHDLARSAAAVAFYCLFSMVPILMVATSLAAAFIGHARAQDELGYAARVMFNEPAREYLLELVRERPSPAFTGVSSIFGVMVLLFVASKAVVELREALSLVFGVREYEGRRGIIVGAVSGRLIAIFLVFALGGVLALSALVEGVVRLVVAQLGSVIPINVVLLDLGQNGLSLVFVVLVFALILRWLPPRPPRFRDAMIGAVVAGVLFVGTKSLVAVYLEKSTMAGVYGAAFTLVVILLWLYFTIQMFFVGAETAAYLSRKRAEERERASAGGHLD